MSETLYASRAESDRDLNSAVRWIERAGLHIMMRGDVPVATVFAGGAAWYASRLSCHPVRAFPTAEFAKGAVEEALRALSARKAGKLLRQDSGGSGA
jgi:hypothetical protein